MRQRAHLPSLPYSLLLAIVAMTIPAAAEAGQPVFRIRSATAAAAPAPKGDVLSPVIVEQDTWRRIGPGLYRTRDTLAAARAAAGSGANREWFVSSFAAETTYRGTFDVSYSTTLSEVGFFAEIRDRFANNVQSLKATPSIRDGYLYIDANGPLWVRGPALAFYDFRRVQ